MCPLTVTFSVSTAVTLKIVQEHQNFISSLLCPHYISTKFDNDQTTDSQDIVLTRKRCKRHLQR